MTPELTEAGRIRDALSHELKLRRDCECDECPEMVPVFTDALEALAVLERRLVQTEDALRRIEATGSVVWLDAHTIAREALRSERATTSEEATRG